MNRIKTGKRIYKSKIQLIKINLSWVLPALMIIIFGLGFSGFIALGEDEGLYAIHSAALKSLQLFILSLGPADLGNWQTRLASILAPLTTVSAAFVA